MSAFPEPGTPGWTARTLDLLQPGFGELLVEVRQQLAARLPDEPPEAYALALGAIVGEFAIGLAEPARARFVQIVATTARMRDPERPPAIEWSVIQ